MIRRITARFAVAAVALGTAFAPAARAADALTAQRFALARYFYGYQADTRKPLPAGLPTRGPGGASIFSVQPMVGIGPWFGYGHAMWHRENLTGMRRAGIDVALPVFRADDASLNGYAERGLDSLTAALIELKRDRQDYPLIGMYYDTTSLGTSARPLDVSGEAGKAAFYRGIRRFFRRVPEEFRALAQTRNGLAAILAVGPSSGLSGLDGSLRAYVDERFLADFGRRLVWIGETDWKARANNLDGYAFFNDGRGLKVSKDGPITTAAIGPGYNDTAINVTHPSLRTRNAGLTMIAEWRALFDDDPAWILLETWNDFAQGSALAPSRNFGVRETDQTMAGLLQFRGESGAVTQALRVNAPEVVPPRAVVPIEVVVQNGSLEQWGRGNIMFSASWYQNGALVEEGPRVPVMQPVPMMGLFNAPVVLVSAKKDGSPLPEGDYEVRVEFFKVSVGEDKKMTVAPFDAPAAVIPVRVGTPEAASARLVTSDASPYLMAGEASTSRVVVRNEGNAPWPKGKVRIGWRLVREDAPDGAALASGQSAPFDVDVAPGLLAPVAALDVRPPKDAVENETDGTPYVLMWEVLLGADRIPVTEAPGVAARRAVQVYPTVMIAHFPLGSNAPATWEAGTDREIRTAVRNIGPTTWKASEVKVGYHWYYWDGTEAMWDSPKMAIPRDIKPGEEALLRFTATAPPNAGAYVFVADIWDGTRWISTLPATAGFDTSLAYVNVAGGNLRPVDLTGLFDLDGIASEINTGDGDFQGGASFPAEQMPPDVQPPLAPATAPRGPYPPGIVPVLYPAGYFGPLDTVGLQSIRRLPFRFPDKRDGERNFILARGQKLPVGVGAYNRLYLLATATENTEGTFRLNYADGTTSDVPVKVSAWTAGPQHGEPVGLETTYVRQAAADDPSRRAYLYVYEIPVISGRVLHAITFPENRAIRVAAITADHKPTFQMPSSAR